MMGTKYLLQYARVGLYRDLVLGNIASTFASSQGVEYKGHLYIKNDDPE